MAKTVRMTRDGKFCDIFDSPETIATAISEGWKPVKEEPVEEAPAKVEKVEKKAEKKPVKKGKK